MHAKHKNSRAFTLVETLVAIAILMISISGPLAIANKALTASLYAKDQSTASFLAQEEMEMIKNTKDNNIVSSASSWLASAASAQDMSTCVAGNPCDLTMVQSGTAFNQVVCSSSGCPLYLSTNGSGYNYNHFVGPSYGTLTPFSRDFYLSSPAGGSCSSGDSECQVTVVVTWNEGTVQNAVTLSSEILNVAP